MAVTKLIAQMIELFSGDTKLINITVLDQDSVVVDLTGASVDFIIAKYPGHTALITKTIGSGVVLTDAANGIMDVTLLPADTESLQGAYNFQCKVTDLSGRESTVLHGTVTILKNS